MNFIKRKFFERLMIVILCVVVFLVGVSYILNRQWRPVLTSILQNVIIQASDSLYRLDVSDINVNIFLGNVTIDEIHIYPDTNTYNFFKAKRIAPENTFELKIKRLSLKNIRPFKIYFKREIELDDIIIREPDLVVEYNRLRFQRKNKSDTIQDNRTLYQRIQYLINSIRVEGILLSNVNFQYIDKSLSVSNPTITSVNKLQIRLRDILIDSVAQFDTTRLFSAAEISADLREYDYLTSDSLYIFKLDRLQLSTLKKDLIVTNVSLMPRYDEMTFSRLFETQKERYRLVVDSLKVEDINYPALLDERLVRAHKIRIVKPDLGVFLNREKERVSFDKGKNFPALLLRNANWTIDTDTVEIRNGSILYTEYNPETESKGTISFQNLRGTISNATNDSLAVSKKGFAKINLRTIVQQKGDLRININLNLNDNAGAFTVNASLAPTPISAFNSVTRPLAKVMVSSGEINSLEFTANGNVNSARGVVKLNYSDLNVILMKTDEENNLKRMGLISVVANALLIKRDNPERNSAMRISYPFYTREPHGSFFNLIWKVLFTGVKESLGVTKEQEAKMKNKAAAFLSGKEKREQRKIDRQERKDN